MGLHIARKSCVDIVQNTWRRSEIEFNFFRITSTCHQVAYSVKSMFFMLMYFKDWIAHGILDSVVDSFFPFLKDIGRQVLAVESLVFSHNDISLSTGTLVDINHIPTDNLCDSEVEKFPDTPLPCLKEEGENTPSCNSRVSGPRFTQSIFFQRLKRNLHNLLKIFATSRGVRAPTRETTRSTLLRMARARRLVTSLTRLLVTKSEVVSQIRKRFIIAGRQTASPQGNEDVEIAIYMGDVQGKNQPQRFTIYLNFFRSYFDFAAIPSSL